MKGDFAVRSDPSSAGVSAAYRYQTQALNAFLCVVGQQCRWINDSNLIFDTKQIYIIFGIEPARTRGCFNLGTVPDNAIGERNFLNAGFTSKEVIFDKRCVKGKDPVDIFELNQQIVALANNRYVFGQCARLDNNPVNIGCCAQFGNNVIVAIKAE